VVKFAFEEQSPSMDEPLKPYPSPWNLSTWLTAWYLGKSAKGYKWVTRFGSFESDELESGFKKTDYITTFIISSTLTDLLLSPCSGWPRASLAVTRANL